MQTRGGVSKSMSSSERVSEWLTCSASPASRSSWLRAAYASLLPIRANASGEG